ncbi:MAG TPA: phosphatidylglycerophosphatase A [Dokdonella sp.]
MKLDAAQRRAILGDAAGWIASGFGAGLSPYAPGTVGSAVALIPWIALRELPLPFYVCALVLAFALGVWASNRVVATLRIDDPGVIVWDEFVGQWIACLPLLLVARDARWIALAFVLFRLFDIGKPWPVAWADRRLKGGFGVMFDDVLAGLYAAAALALTLYLL